MPPASSGAGAGSSLLDASYFDADAYLKRLIKGSRLEELAAQHHELVAEVGALDQDMQTLVYENYSKFIAATDTIREMNGEMAGLDGRIRSLDGLIGTQTLRFPRTLASSVVYAYCQTSPLLSSWGFKDKAHNL